MKYLACLALLALAGCVTVNSKPLPPTACDKVRAGKPQGMPEGQWADVEMACFEERMDALFGERK